MRITIVARLVTTAALAACAAPRPSAPAAPIALPPGAEAVSLRGEPLMRPTLSDASRQRLEAQLAEARAAWQRDTTNADAIIWLGRRTAYLGRYREAIDIFSRGIALHPADARMYRHRGHRWITLRRFDEAVADLARAAEFVRGRPDQVEPDGQPNPAGIPTSTLHSNVWYHLALAHYLKGDFVRALPAWRAAYAATDNDDNRVAAGDWLYMTLRRLGRAQEAAAVLAPIRADMRILENHAYHRRLLMYKGELPVDSLLRDDGDALQLATQGYGVGNWYLVNGDTTRAVAAFERVIATGNWPAFGYIAAEADLVRLR